MRIPDPPIDPERIAEFTAQGWWVEETSNDALEHWARAAPDGIAIIDGRVRLSFAEYYRQAEKLAAISLGSESAPMMSSRSSSPTGASSRSRSTRRCWPASRSASSTAISAPARSNSS
jgi:hypothetical protein